MQVESLARMIEYVLAGSPDEFALLPDAEGFVPVKELLKVLHEEPSWRHVRQGGLQEVLMGENRDLFETEGKRIRALERHWVYPGSGPPLSELPKLLYTPVTTRAHPVVLEKGLRAREGGFILISEDRATALRMGLRREREPVVLEIRAAASRSRRGRFYAFGSLFVSPEISAEWIAGPPVSKKILEERSRSAERREEARSSLQDFAPGTFLLEQGMDPDPQRRAKGRKRRGWKEDARKERRRL